MFVFLRSSIFYIVLTLLLAGCASLPVHTNTVEAPFVHHVEKFYEHYTGAQPKGLVVRFAKSEGGGFHGQCQITESGQLTIDVSHAAWDGLCPSQQKALIFHELGHCLLNREHTTEATSYMYSEMLPCDHYDRNAESLDRELF